jgi:hypothetical protein
VVKRDDEFSKKKARRATRRATKEHIFPSPFPTMRASCTAARAAASCAGSAVIPCLARPIGAAVPPRLRLFSTTSATTSTSTPPSDSSPPTTGAASGSGTTHFGFKTVEEGEKAKLVEGVFRNVASRCALGAHVRARHPPHSLTTLTTSAPAATTS